MRKRRLLFWSSIVFFVSLLALSFVKFEGFLRTGFDITVVNETEKNVNGLNITYGYITKDIEIPIIPPKSIYKFYITPQEQFGENTMRLYYFDNNKIKHSEIIFGYFEKGYFGQATIKVTSLDKNGKMKIQIKGSMWE